MASKSMIFDQSKHFEFSVGKAIKWFETHPYQHIAVFSKRRREYYENDNPNNPAKFTSLKQNVVERSQHFNYSVGNAIKQIKEGKIQGRFLIYSKRLLKWFVNKAYNTDKFADLDFMEPPEAAKTDEGGGESKGPAAPAAPAAAPPVAMAVPDVDPCKLASIDVATCPIKDLNPHTHPCLPKRNVLLFHTDKNMGCEECAKKKSGIWMNRCQLGTGGQGGGRRKTKKRHKRKHKKRRKTKMKRKRKTKRRKRRRRRHSRKR